MKQTISSSDAQVISHPQNGEKALVHKLPNAGSGGIVVEGNVEGDILINNKKIEVNAEKGAVVNFYDGQPRVKKRDAASQPVRPVRGFINRVKELEKLRHVMGAKEIALLYGSEGLGRTALLKQAANSEAARAFPDGVLYMEGVDESGQVLSAGDMVQRIFDRSHESEPHLKVTWNEAQPYLSNLKALVVLNGLGFPASSFAQVADLFSAGAVLIESEHPLDSEIMDEIKLGPLPRQEAMELLAAKSGIDPQAGTHSTLDAICALLADVPLAIVVAGKAIRENQLSLPHTLNILKAVKTQSGDEIRRGLERAYEHARSTLTELEQQWLTATAFAPGISVDPKYLHEMAADPATAERTQERMQSMELLTRNSPRLRIAPALREIARRGQEEAPYQERLMTYLKSMLGTRSLNWDYCSDELGNILGMIQWAARRQRWSDVITLGRDIDSYLILHGLWEAWQNVLEEVLPSARQLGDRVTEAWALHQLGTRALGLGLNAQALNYLRQALELRRQLGDRVGMAYTQHNLDLLIPPAPPSDGGQPPHPPRSPLRPIMILGVSTIVVLLMAVSSFVMARALYQARGAASAPLVIPVSDPTETAAETATVTPTLTPTETKTATPTLTDRPTRTPTSTRTVTPTSTATEQLLTDSSGIGVPRLTTNLVYFGAASCDPSQVTIQVTARHPAGIKALIFFHRLHESGTNRDSGWSDGIAMNPRANDLYTLTVSASRLLGNSGFTAETSASYQFVIQANNKELKRSQVYMDLFLVPCGNKRPAQPGPSTDITVTPVTPVPIQVDPGSNLPDYKVPIQSIPLPKLFVPTTVIK